MATTTPLPHEVRAVPVGQLFSPTADRYSIPLYQRNYTWGEEQIHRLIHDVLDEAERDDSKEYFLGNLVVAPPTDVHEVFDVIDGQQRLTTLYILLSRLRRVSELRDLIGELQTLTYESRDKATRALRHVAEDLDAEDEEPVGEDSGIRRAGRIIDSLLREPRMRQRFLTPQVIEYLMQRVLLVRMPIDRATDLNRYFEVMNTRGAQLSPVDIVKARLLRYLPDHRDRALLNHVWTACSDMEHYVVMTATPGDTAWRAQVFGPEWVDLPTRNFDELRALLVERDDDTASLAGEVDSPAGSAALSFTDAVTHYARAGVDREVSEASFDDRFTSQITFPTFLLHVLMLRRSASDESAARDERQLDDKILVHRFAELLEGLPQEERRGWVREFTTDLLRARQLFDNYILKRDATLTSGHESTTDEEPGSWSLYRVSRSDVRRGRSVSHPPRYRSPFATADPRDRLHDRILLLQSALRITYTSPRTMHWITAVLRHVTQRADRGEEITPQGVLATLESFALARLDEGIRPTAISSGEAPDTSPDGLPTGFALPRIVFTYLDYLLVDELDRWDFTFSYRTSVEHFSPMKEDSEHASEPYRVHDRRLLDWLGNLALVTVSANSKFSNYQPAHKAENMTARRQSLKLDLMAQHALAERSWNDADIRTHHEAMVGLLRSALANRRSLT